MKHRKLDTTPEISKRMKSLSHKKVKWNQFLQKRYGIRDLDID